MDLVRPNLGLGAVLALAAFLISYLAVLIFKRWAVRRRLLDTPNERSSHTHPTPRGAGLVIATLTLLGLAGLALLWGPAPWRPLCGYAAGAVLIAGISWLDDSQGVSAGIRLALHAAATGALLIGTGVLSSVAIPIYGPVQWGSWGIPLMTLWVLGLTNAYNFMDGIDGIAGAQAVLTALGWAILGWFACSPVLFGLSILLAALTLGFLIHNWPPATIFMGDVGSAFLGYTFAALPLLACSMWSDRTTAIPRLPLAGAVFLWPFLFDTSVTFIRRLIRKENVFAAHRSHFYQRLVIAGFSHTAVTLAYSCLASLGMAAGLIWVLLGNGIPLLVVPGLGAVLWGVVRRTERKRLQQDIQAPPA